MGATGHPNAASDARMRAKRKSATFSMTVTGARAVVYVEVPGTHSFLVWSTGLRAELDWLAKRTGLVS